MHTTVRPRRHAIAAATRSARVALLVLCVPVALVAQTKTAVVGGPLAWNNSNTWIPSGIPTSSHDVVIPAGANIAMDGACVAGTVRVEGLLGAAPQNGRLAARWVMVTGSTALLHVGTATAPFLQSFTIELNATDQTENIQGAGTKFLMAMDGGTIELHGAPKKSWTKLDAVLGNGTAIVVEDLTNWQVGDSIVVAYTGHVNDASPANLPGFTYNPYSGPSSQVRQITAITPATRTIQLSAPIDPARHCAAAPTTHWNTPGTQSWTLDQRAEVGMLTHNIVVRGAATSGGFGAHVMLMACCTQMPPGAGRFEHVEFTEVGQQRVLGRYPVHWHMQRDSGLGQYVRHSSIHKTYNRAVTLHGSHNVVVEGNVCHDVAGHAVFLEDGVERGNQILRNLVLAAQKPAQCSEMLLHDNSLDKPQNRSPAAFWISHPDNRVIGNVAADSLGVGYWFALHSAPTGLSRSTTVPQDWLSSFSTNGTPWNATREALGAFQGNVSHSMKMGIDIHDTIVETSVACPLSPPLNPISVLDPRNDNTQSNHIWQPKVSAVLSGFTAYGCTTGIYAGGGVQPIGTITFRNCVLADNGVHMQLASLDTVEQSLLIYNTGNGILPTPLSTPPFTSGPYQPYEMGHAYVVYDGPGTLRDSHLIGYDGTGPGSVIFGEFGAARRHVNHKVSGLTFGGGASAIPNVVLPTFANQPSPNVWGFTIRDLDGSLSRGLFAGRSLVGSHEMTHLVKTNGRTDDIAAGGRNGWLSPFRWGHLQVRYYVSPTTVDLPHVRFVRHATAPWAQATVNVTDLQMRQIPVIVTQVGSGATQFTYQVDVINPPPPSPPTSANRIDVSLDDVETSDSVRVLVSNPTNTPWGPNLKVVPNGGTTLDQLHNNAGDPYSLPDLQQQNPHAPNSTSWFLASPSVIDLRLVTQADPISGGRTQRVSIIW